MKIQISRAASLPKQLTSELLTTDRSEDGCPGLIVSTKPLLEQNKSIAKSVDGLLGQRYPRQFPALIATPAATSSLFSHTNKLSLLKSVASLIAEQVHPNLKLGVDAIWLVYGAAQLHDEWTKPGADQGACAFKLASLGLSTVNLVGGFDPELKLPDSWSNGINFCVKHGEAYYLGKTPPINELMLSTEKYTDIPLKALKVAGVSLDPQAMTGVAAFGVTSHIALIAPKPSSGKQQ
ncbi:MAG: hypothetical protein LCH73_08635 [Proteobacteria bacterium]|nr:hypothetical protein [Pseudomonadota bacterium]